MTDHATAAVMPTATPAQLQDLKKNEDPRLSFCTPEFKDAQRTFTEAFKVGQ